MKTFFQLREELDNNLLSEQDLHMVVHDGEEHHIIKGMSHTKSNANKVRNAVSKAAAKHAGVSHSDMKNDYGGYNHHEYAESPGAAKTRTHKSLDHYVKYHAKNDARNYGTDE